MKTSDWIRNFITTNGSYKIVALFVTLILWITIMGRRDFTYTRELELELHVRPGLILAEMPPPVKITVRGPRLALRRFQQRTSPVAVDLGQYTEGPVLIRLSPDRIPVTEGLRVISVEPRMIEVYLEKTAPSEEAEPAKNEAEQ